MLVCVFGDKGWGMGCGKQVCYEVWWWLISFLMRDGWGGADFENDGFGLGGVYGRKGVKKERRCGDVVDRCFVCG